MTGRKPVRTAVITGASSGIGESTAILLARGGWRVFAGVRTEAAAEALTEAAPAVVPLMLDVTSDELVAAAAGAVAEQLTSDGPKAGGIDALINNAGIVTAGPLEHLPLEQLAAQLEINVIGQLRVTQHFLPLLRHAGAAGRSPRIIMVSSISDRIALPFLGPYAASKGALSLLTDALRRELFPWRIRVALVEPGRIRTPLREKTMQTVADLLDRLPPEAHRLYGATFERQTAKRMGVAEPTTAEHVARLIGRICASRRPRPRYLVGPDARVAALLAAIAPRRLVDRLVQ